MHPSVVLCRELALLRAQLAGGEEARPSMRMLPFDADLMAVACGDTVIAQCPCSRNQPSDPGSPSDTNYKEPTQKYIRVPDCRCTVPR